MITNQLTKHYYLLSNKRRKIILPRSFRCVIFFIFCTSFVFFFVCTVLCCDAVVISAALFGSLWHKNAGRVHTRAHTHSVCVAGITFCLPSKLHERSVCTIYRPKCKICEYLHNWMIWYSIRQFECHSSLWCLCVCVYLYVRIEQRPSNAMGRIWLLMLQQPPFNENIFRTLHSIDTQIYHMQGVSK